MDTEIKTATVWNDLYDFNDFKHPVIEEFKSEKEMCDYIDFYAKEFAEDILGIEYGSHKREYYLGKNLRYEKNKGTLPHADFLFVSSTNEAILIECKFPYCPFAQLNAAIGQVLAYFCLARKNGVKISRICVVTTKSHDMLHEIIKEFHFPIEVCIINKSQVFKFPK